MTQSEQPSKSSAFQTRMMTFTLTAKTLIPLVLGVVLFFAGVAFTGFSLSDSDLSESILSVLLVIGIVSLALGIGLLVLYIRTRLSMKELYLPEFSTALALNVAAEFLIGVWLVVVGVSNVNADTTPEEFWSLAAIAALGSLMVADSLLLYRRGFRHAVDGKKDL